MLMITLPTVEQWRVAGRTFGFRGHQIFARIEGQGDVLLLIHGFPTSSWDWCKVWPDLTQRFTVVAPDLLGLGFSSKPRGYRYRIAEQADICLAALEQIGAKEAQVLAHDYGDTVAQELLARYNEGSCPVNLSAFTFLNGGLFPETHRALPVQKLLASPVGPLIARIASKRSFCAGMLRIAGTHPPSDEELSAAWALVTHGSGQLAWPGLIDYIRERREQRARWVGALVHAKVPLAVVDGLDDPISGAHMVTRLRELVPHARVSELQGVGHYPQLEAPERVVAALSQVMPGWA